jgi:murein DD-endopeptidase MepM/ murein hydrolase activator NlpD
MTILGRFKWLFMILGIIIAMIALFVILKTTCKPVPIKKSAPLQTKAFSPKAGEIFFSVLKRALISQTISDQIIQTLRVINFKFTELRPTDTFEFYYKSDTLIKFEYKKNYTTIYRFDNLETSNITIAMAYKVLRTELKMVKGEISSSLYESMLKIGEKPTLIVNYADILAWDVDFFTESQNGDSFYVLVEKKYDDTICIDYGQVRAVRYKGQIGDFSGYYFVDPNGHIDYYDYQGKSMRKAFLKSPLRYSYISSYFSSGRYHPILKIVRPHHGIDYVAPSGTPVSAIGDGTVTFAGWRDGYGRLVEIVHSQRIKSRYGHLRGFGANIRSGHHINQGQIVGYVGMTGLATGPHLHFELLQNGSWVNPLKIIPPRAEPVKVEYFQEFTKHRDSLYQYLQNLNY